MKKFFKNIIYFLLSLVFLLHLSLYYDTLLSTFILFVSLVLVGYTIAKYRSMNSLFSKIINLLTIMFAIILYYGSISYVDYSKYNKVIQHNNHILQNLDQGVTNVASLNYFTKAKKYSKEKHHNDMLDYMKFRSYYDQFKDSVFDSHAELLNNQKISNEFLDFRTALKTKEYHFHINDYDQYSIFTHKMFNLKLFLHYQDNELEIVKKLCFSHEAVAGNMTNVHILNILQSENSLNALFMNQYKKQILSDIFNQSKT